jgi:hypothetical protein
MKEGFPGERTQGGRMAGRLSIASLGFISD